MLGRFCEYTISSRSSSVLEQTMLPSAVVTATPPELEKTEGGQGSQSGVLWPDCRPTPAITKARPCSNPSSAMGSGPIPIPALPAVPAVPLLGLLAVGGGRKVVLLVHAHVQLSQARLLLVSLHGWLDRRLDQVLVHLPAAHQQLGLPQLVKALRGFGGGGAGCEECQGGQERRREGKRGVFHPTKHRRNFPRRPPPTALSKAWPHPPADKHGPPPWDKCAHLHQQVRHQRLVLVLVLGDGCELGLRLGQHGLRHCRAGWKEGMGRGDGGREVRLRPDPGRACERSQRSHSRPWPPCRGGMDTDRRRTCIGGKRPEEKKNSPPP